jgi:predicted  nucleic acid-binding Zn-ribbon protein
VAFSEADDVNDNHSKSMKASSQQESVLQQLLGLHEVDMQVSDLERENRECQETLAAMDEGVADLEANLERLDVELKHAREDARRSERATDDRRAQLDRIRSRVNQVKNQRQYSAASLEFDLVRQDLRKLEDHVLERLQVVEDMEARRKELLNALEEARGSAEPKRERMKQRVKELEDELAIKRDRRYNLAIRVDRSVLILYDRIRSGRSEVALAPLTEEGHCGHCFTSVTIQQEMQIKSMSVLVCCEGCGVILYPESFKRGS